MPEGVVPRPALGHVKRDGAGCASGHGQMVAADRVGDHESLANADAAGEAALRISAGVMVGSRSQLGWLV